MLRTHCSRSLGRVQSPEATHLKNRRPHQEANSHPGRPALSLPSTRSGGAVLREGV